MNPIKELFQDACKENGIPFTEVSRVRHQGKCVVENYEGILMVMFPDGSLCPAVDKASAEKICKEWFKRETFTNDVGIGQIEWRLK